MSKPSGRPSIRGNTMHADRTVYLMTTGRLVTVYDNGVIACTCGRTASSKTPPCAEIAYVQDTIKP